MKVSCGYLPSREASQRRREKQLFNYIPNPLDNITRKAWLSRLQPRSLASIFGSRNGSRPTHRKKSLIHWSIEKISSVQCSYQQSFAGNVCQENSLWSKNYRNVGGALLLSKFLSRSVSSKKAFEGTCYPLLRRHFFKRRCAVIWHSKPFCNFLLDLSWISMF